jgi:hypothetical protein
MPARLRGGPLDGQLVQAPVDQSKLPASVIGLPVPDLDEQTEMFWWDTANYFRLSPRTGWHPDDSWDFAYARTLPGYPTYTPHVPALDPRGLSI